MRVTKQIWNKYEVWTQNKSSLELIWVYENFTSIKLEIWGFMLANTVRFLKITLKQNLVSFVSTETTTELGNKVVI